ncbi:hypothetical protein BV22DRAFT_1108572 [Leucogyrophana mollusca]|uniref:Uncharacterized protein n=1 Tax=Leucogyrophana mollusca TaxID=85980 RepID=A0ACB8AVQ3_9AGAM|nr:hypothetical protein BV22DRAFT_1108572 [Leucogyrophana mollusca]
MFADDTTIYLKKSDNYNDLEAILGSWCQASGAKFNLEKTEIIPIGSQKHRDEILLTRKLNPESPPIKQSVNIAKDGQPIRSLGAWIGNKVDNPATWEQVLNKVNKALMRWKEGNPTLNGKRLIVQMIAGGMTQFLTKAQGMPENIENSLISTIRKFIWGEVKSPPIGIEHLYKPPHEGGINLLDIKSRNLAIEITKRAPWTFVTDILINNLKPSGIKSNEDLNTFLHLWSPPTQGTRANTLPNEQKKKLQMQ